MNARLVRIIKRLALLGLAYLAVLAGTYVYSELAEPPGIRVDQANKPLLTPSERAALHPDTRAGLEAYEAENYQRAHALWLPRAEAGDAEAMFGMGRIFDRGAGVRRDLSLAAYWYSQASRNLHYRAIFNLANFYRNGVGVPQDISRSRELYIQAFDGRIAEAAFNIGMFYRHAVGVEKNLKSELYWFTQSARLCDAEALFRVGLAYMNGELFDQNSTHGYHLMTMSILNGNKGAKVIDFYQLFLLTPWDYVRARKSAWHNQNDSCAQGKIARISP